MSGACTKNDVIYADCAATRPLSDAVRAAMEPYLDGGKFGNASSIHRRGRDAARAVLDARCRIAEVLGCDRICVSNKLPDALVQGAHMENH